VRRPFFRRLSVGAHRTVFLVWRFAVKVPNGRYDLSAWLAGWRANRNEYLWWVQHPHESLCPIRLSAFFSLVLVMPRCEPVEDWTVGDFHRMCRRFRETYGFDPPVEQKDDSFGLLDGRIVAVDYAWW
jgi:hypothetical protein